MIACIIFVFITFFISYKLRPYFGRFGFLRGFISLLFSVTVLFALIYFLDMNFNFMGLVKTKSNNINLSKIPIIYITILIFAFLGFIVDLLLIYASKILNWFREKVSDFFENKR